MVVFSEDHIQETRRRGRIEVICGSMFSGKTEELIRRLKRAKFARQRVMRPQDLGLWDKNMNFRVELGSFKVMLGASSTDIRLHGQFEITP